MSKKDYYIVEKNVNKILRGEYTNFLDPNTQKLTCSKLKGINYHIFYTYKDSEKNIIYTNKLPQIKLLEIISNEKITHREIMGSLYGLNIDSEMFGDIIITDSHYYILVMDSIYNYIFNNYHMVGSHYIKLIEREIDSLSSYERKYDEIDLIVSSLRIDTIISRLICSSRDNIKNKFSNDEIIVNYELCHKHNYILKENDIFSIKKYGKYKFIGIIKNTKKDNYLIKINKYVDK